LHTATTSVRLPAAPKLRHSLKRMTRSAASMRAAAPSGTSPFPTIMMRFPILLRSSVAEAVDEVFQLRRPLARHFGQAKLDDGGLERSATHGEALHVAMGVAILDPRPLRLHQGIGAAALIGV